MKLKRLLSLAVLCIVGMSSAWADTTLLTTANGWTKITEIPSNSGNYYFAFVDNSANYMLSYEEGVNQSTNAAYKTMVYRTSKDAAMNPAMLWELAQISSGKYSIKCAIEPTLFIQTENNAFHYCRTHDNGGNNNSWYTWGIAYSNGAWRIQNGKDATCYIGPWDNNGVPSNGLNVAANCINETGTSRVIGKFQIYAIEKSRVNWTANATLETPANMTYKIKNATGAFNGTDGWTGVSSTNNLDFKRNSGAGFDGFPGILESSNWGASNYSQTISQTITEIPNGLYKLRAAVMGATGCTIKANIGGNDFTFPVNGDTGGSIDKDGNTVAQGSGQRGFNWGETESYSVTGGRLTITFSSSATTVYQWANIDNVELYLLGTYLMDDAIAIPNDGNIEAGKWYYYTAVADNDYIVTATTLGDIVYSTNGEQLTYQATGSALTENMHWAAGKIYIKSSSNNNIDIKAANYTPGQDFTAKIQNPGFEMGNMTGWTVANSNDTGAKSTTNDTYKALGTEGNYVFNHWANGTALTQNIGTLPAGIYQLSAMLATGDSPTNKGVVYLTVNGTKSAGMVSRNGRKDVMHRETITFISDGTSDITIGAIGGDTGNGGHWWYKADDFKLTYINKTSELSSLLGEVKSATEPWTNSGDYYTQYTSHSSASTQEAILTAINYMNSKYDDYAWDNASAEHPYLMENIIKGAELDNNDPWPGSGRSLASQSTWKGQHWSGDTSRDYFEQNHENSAARTQSVTIPFAGQYTLNTAVRVLQSGAYAEIGVGDDKVRTTNVTGATGGNINIDGTEGTNNMANAGNGFGWIYNKVVFAIGEDNTAKSISINLSNRDKSHAADAGGMFLYYIGDTFDYTKNGVHFYSGAWANENVELTNAVPVLDVTAATGSFNVTATNTNGLVYTNGATINGDANIVSNGTCADLVLTDGGTFKAHKNFTATKASYEMTAIAGGKFGTLMLPFAPSTMPDGNKVYTLDQGVSFGEEIHATEADEIAANAPVLVTKAETYSASSVQVAATNDTYTNGELVGTYKAMDALENTYVLQKHGNRVAFFMVNDVQPTVNPFRAYIKAQSAGARDFLNVVFDDETGLDRVNESTGQQVNQIYDLSGRRVNNAVKGIYIINGKKVIK